MNVATSLVIVRGDERGGPVEGILDEALTPPFESFGVSGSFDQRALIEARYIGFTDRVLHGLGVVMVVQS